MEADLRRILRRARSCRVSIPSLASTRRVADVKAGHDCAKAQQAERSHAACDLRQHAGHRWALPEEHFSHPLLDTAHRRASVRADRVVRHAASVPDIAQQVQDGRTAHPHLPISGIPLLSLAPDNLGQNRTACRGCAAQRERLYPAEARKHSSYSPSAAKEGGRGKARESMSAEVVCLESDAWSVRTQCRLVAAQSMSASYIVAPFHLGSPVHRMAQQNR
eukprot:137722-Rhodomonas_salina.4